MPVCAIAAALVVTLSSATHSRKESHELSPRGGVAALAGGGQRASLLALPVVRRHDAHSNHRSDLARLNVGVALAKRGALECRSGPAVKMVLRKSAYGTARHVGKGAVQVFQE
jgi:hypothetical protein